MRKLAVRCLFVLALIGLAPAPSFSAPEAAKKTTTQKTVKKAPKKKAPAKPAKKPAPPAAPTAEKKNEKTPDLNALADFQGANSKEPTYIKSDSLTLNSSDRVFTYTGNVEVKQGEMTLTCGEIVGRYNAKNQIETIDARKDIVIVKGEMRGASQKARFEAGPNTITLTDNPSIEQQGSILSADTIKIFLNDNRSVAEGAVRVKLVEKSIGANTINLP